MLYSCPDSMGANGAVSRAPHRGSYGIHVQDDARLLLRRVYRSSGRQQLRAAAVRHLPERVRDTPLPDHPAHHGQLRGPADGRPAVGAVRRRDRLPRVHRRRAYPDRRRAGAAHRPAPVGRPVRGHPRRGGGLRDRRRDHRGAREPHRRGVPDRRQGERHEPAPFLLLLGQCGRGAAVHGVLRVRGRLQLASARLRVGGPAARQRPWTRGMRGCPWASCSAAGCSGCSSS